MRKNILFFIAFAAFNHVGNAQSPVLTAADFGTDFHCIGHDGNVGSPSSTPFTMNMIPSSSVWGYTRSIPVSSVPNAANFPQATSASKIVSAYNGSVTYYLYQTDASSHRLIAQGTGNNVTAANTTFFTFPFELNDVSSIGKYIRYGTVNSPYGVYNNVIQLHFYEVSGTLTTSRYTYIATNPYRVIGSVSNYSDSSGGGTGSNSSVYEFIPYLLSEQEFGQNAFFIYPNPTSTDITVQNNSVFNSDAFATVYDILGKALISKQKLDSDWNTLNLQNLTPGIYIVKITNDQNQVLHTQKIVKN